jgi:phage gpG-like protein
MSELVTFYEWEPNPEEVAQALEAVANYVEDTRVPLVASREIARRDMQEHFDTETDPDGMAWAPLDDLYVEGKITQGYSEQILQRTQDLMHAATSEEAWDVFSDTLVFNADVLPRSDDKYNVNYGLVHQAGKSAVMGPHGRPEGGLPARPFIGLSDQAEAEIIEVFDVWYEEGASRIYIQPTTGTIQRRMPAGSGAGGQFAKPGFMPEF